MANWFDPEKNPVAKEAQILAYSFDSRAIFRRPVQEIVEIIKKLAKVERFFSLVKQRMLEYPFASGLKPELKEDLYKLILEAKKVPLDPRTVIKMADAHNLTPNERLVLRRVVLEINDRLELILNAFKNIQLITEELGPYLLACEDFLKRGKVTDDLRKEMERITELREKFSSTSKATRGGENLNPQEIGDLKKIEIFTKFPEVLYKALVYDQIVGGLQKTEIAARLKLSEKS